MTITDEMVEAAAVAFWGTAGAACAAEDERDGLRDALAAAVPLIEAARLRAFADELMRQRDQVSARDLREGTLRECLGRKDGLEEAADLARAAAGEGGNGEARGDRPTAAG